MDNKDIKNKIYDIIGFIGTRYKISSHEANMEEYLSGTKAISIIFNNNFEIEYFISDNKLIKDYWDNPIDLTKDFNKYLLIENRNKVIDNILTNG